MMPCRRRTGKVEAVNQAGQAGQARDLKAVYAAPSEQGRHGDVPLAFAATSEQLTTVRNRMIRQHCPVDLEEVDGRGYQVEFVIRGLGVAATKAFDEPVEVGDLWVRRWRLRRLSSSAPSRVRG
jgi:hypothetical protein